MGWGDMCCGAGVVIFSVLCVLCVGSVSLLAYRIYTTIKGIDRDYERLCGRVCKLEERGVSALAGIDTVEAGSSEEVQKEE